MSANVNAVLAPVPDGAMPSVTLPVEGDGYRSGVSDVTSGAQASHEATDLGNPTLLGHGLLNRGAAVAGLGPPLASSPPRTASGRRRLDRASRIAVRVRVAQPVRAPCA